MSLPPELMRTVADHDRRIGKLETWEGSDGTNQSVLVVASENLAAGDLVDIWNDGGTAKARKASATLVYAADGFVSSAVTSGATARVFLSGVNSHITGATPGTTLYLSTTAGGILNAAPDQYGELVQKVGVAITATSMTFQPTISILLN